MRLLLDYDKSKKRAMWTVVCELDCDLNFRGEMGEWGTGRGSCLVVSSIVELP